MARSNRAFDGRFSECLIWFSLPETQLTGEQEIDRRIHDLDARLIPSSAESDVLDSPFGNQVLASAAAASLVEPLTNIPVWMDADSIFLNERFPTLKYPRHMHEHYLASRLPTVVDDLLSCRYDRLN